MIRIQTLFLISAQIPQATYIPPCFQQLIFEGRKLVDGSLLQGYVNINNATISLASRLHGCVPSSTHPSSYKHVVKKGISTPSGSKAKNSGAKELFGSAFIVDKPTEPPIVDVEYPHIYESSFIYQKNP
jgi:hypothetical protein